ncbi:MAG: SDR family NAD(P)-dependent oxidoreductase [Alphaproteobacteria bacterium]
MASTPLAVVTGASTGIGYELARCCAEDGYDLIICAEEPRIEYAARKLRDAGARQVEAVQADLATENGVDRLCAWIGDREVDALLANAGVGLGHGFLDQDLGEAKGVIDLNITGTISLIQKIGRGMRDRNRGRILVTGSIAGFVPGSFQAVYNGTKAFLDSFSYALGNELKDSNVTVTCLMPGPTETEFFDRAHMEDTRVGQDDDKTDPAKVARDGYEAMKNGESGIVSGFMNKVETTFAGLVPETVLAQLHRRRAEPGRK